MNDRRAPITRTDIINAIVATREYKSYLEIGVRMTSLNFDHIECLQKTCVDPFPENPRGVEYLCTSDTFFSQNTKAFDIVFIDGLHEEDQVDRDIAHTLSSLTPGGVIVIHDALPPSEWYQRPKAEFHPGEAWNGTVWKSVLKAFSVSPIRCFVVDVDWGCAVIDTSRPSCLRPSPVPEMLTYDKDFSSLHPYMMPAGSLSNYLQFSHAV